MLLNDPFCPAHQVTWAECGCASEHSVSTASERVGTPGDTPLSPKNGRSRANNQRRRRNGDTGTPTPPRVTSWTARDLLAADFPDPVWAIDGVLVEGVTLFAGPPKAGKSWLALNACVSVASGGTALGSIPCEQGEALYLALEDTGRRLKSRLAKVLGNSPAPVGLTFATECPVMAAGGLDVIDRWIRQQKNPRLVVVDVFEKIRGPAHLGDSAYTADYGAVSKIKQLADEHHVSLTLIHHVRKVTSQDFINEISGTLGLGGAADTIAVLRRNRGEFDGQLLITGRDVDENEWAVRFDPDLGAWQLLGLASEYGLEKTRSTILRFVQDQGGARLKEIVLGTGLDYELVKKTAQRMADDGQLHRAAGRYVPPPPPIGIPDDDPSRARARDRGVPTVPKDDNPRS